ncbi:MAG: GNAT family N-acetyltransferase [Symploca sp. SIO2B6]|nr:GNAT family N-acetyltransferase [Symploca sp. SIO2B6]
MRHGEVEELLRVIHLSAQSLNSKDYAPEQIREIVQMYHPGTLKKNVFVADYESQVIGVATCHFFGRYCNIDAVFTHPDFVYRGVGRQLVQALEQRALEINAQAMTVTSSLTAVQFYQKLHYNYLGKTKIYGTIDCVQLQKPLRSPTLWEELQQSVGCGFGLLVLLLVVLCI